MTEFPECSKCYRCVQNGRVIYRICDDPTAVFYQRCVEAPVCQRCTSRPGAAPPFVPAGPSPEPMQPELPEPPGLVSRAISYVEAVARWTAAGRPERSDKEVDQIFHRHCKPCGWFDPEKQICRGCGCRVADDGLAVLNKIKMATEHCPREIW